MRAPDWIGQRYVFFLSQVVIESPNTVQATIDRFRAEPSAPQILDIRRNLLRFCFLHRNGKPQNKMFQTVHVIFNGMRRVVPSLHESAVVQHRIGHIHRSVLSR